MSTPPKMALYDQRFIAVQICTSQYFGVGYLRDLATVNDVRICSIEVIRSLDRGNPIYVEDVKSF